MFNDWAEPTLATGSRAANLAWLTSDEHGQLTVGGLALSFDAKDLGFFDAAATPRSARYRPNATLSTGDRTLRSGNAHLVLAQLLLDLQALGLLG